MIFFYIILGLSLAIFGIGIIYDPIFHDTKHNFIYDFSEVKWPLGIFLTLLGVCFLYFSLRRKPNNTASGFRICPICRTTLETINSSENRCSLCGTDLEELDGFYERHPEIKEND